MRRQKESENVAKPQIKKELSIDLGDAPTLADVQQAISDLRAQGAPETSTVMVWGGGIWGGTTVTANWSADR